MQPQSGVAMGEQLHQIRFNGDAFEIYFYNV